MVQQIAWSIMRWRVRISSTIAPWCTNHFSAGLSLLAAPPCRPLRGRCSRGSQPFLFLGGRPDDDTGLLRPRARR